MSKAKFVQQVTVIDPDSKGEVTMEVYKHEGGGMFAIDSSYLEQVMDDEFDLIPDVFTGGGVPVGYVQLID